eukprot:gnl/TRDRNA2_/TRDRNA2_83025_c0_seq1.p1 gnl/TRDRNA2_/TRDRNA2_83025_c0~~gnl/TRDRNA2_/TRDRNA2_83025_c0_seq1.p1  ORF type:complete len:515 (-),score=97.38 gnl/TRDRNA2_/TRDRNA2_83025_c0_seq1:48-1472(-)
MGALQAAAPAEAAAGYERTSTGGHKRARKSLSFGGDREEREDRHEDSVWTEPNACWALCQLILDDRCVRSTCCGGASDSQGGAESSRPRRRALPPALYGEHVAPFLRFDAPQPNMLYAIGGRNQKHGSLSVVEMFDTWHGKWTPCPPMPTRRAGSAAALLPDHRILVVGGYNEKGIVEGLLASCDVYDPFQRCWEQAGSVPPLARARWGHGCATLVGRVYAVGGCSLQQGVHVPPREVFMETLRCCELYLPEENRWRPCAPLQVARSGSRVVALGDRYLAAVGGCDDVFGRAETQPTVELYDLQADCWSLLTTRLANARTTAAVAAIDDRHLAVVGGAPSLASAEIYRVSLPKDSESTQAQEDEKIELEALPAVADMAEGRMGCQAAVVELPAPGDSYPMTTQRCVVVVGGERCTESTGEGSWPRVRQFNCIPVYDIDKKCWRTEKSVPSMSSARTAVALCVGIGHVGPVPSQR